MDSQMEKLVNSCLSAQGLVDDDVLLGSTLEMLILFLLCINIQVRFENLQMRCSKQ